jgi:hypothetical protein
MDRLGKEVYAAPTLTYKYRGEVDVPPLEMVDDIISASKCGSTTVTLNATINSFVERKKLRLNSDKCARVHIGKKHECAPVKVHEVDMKNSVKEKYLGDYVTSQGNSNETLITRKARAFAILSEIRALLQDIPLGSRRMEIGLALRDAWFVNGILYNSEVWGSYAVKHVDELEVIDHMILRCILGAQAKVAVETLYLETSTMSIKSVISVRRMLYLKNILGRHHDEVIRKVYFAMKAKPHKGDWYYLVKSDFQKYGIDMDENFIEETDLFTFKTKVKNYVWNVFLMKCKH